MSNLKSSNIFFFATGLVHGFGQKFVIFSLSCLFRSNTPEKVFHDVLDRKLATLDNKISNLKSGKICIFAKGLVHGFGQPFQIFFSLFFFRSNTPKKVVHYVPDRKLAFLQ